jgi:dipeptidyl aminopeptidase/acylaminoacyl peptidase
VHEHGREFFNADTDKIGVMGLSAGGYLTLTAGFRAEPRPAVLVSFWGYGDLIGDWYSTPSPHPRHNWRQIPAEEALAQVVGPPISMADDRQGNGGVFYNYTRQSGTWPEAVSGWDPHAQAESFFPFMPVKNVTPDYPPTMLIHGTEDTDVPYAQSVMMAEQLEANGVVHELVTIPGGEHGLGGGDPELIAKAYEDMVAWVDRYLR